MLSLLTDRLFDHAGMFPPESKSFEETLARGGTFHEKLSRPSLLNAHIVVTLNDLKKINDDSLKEAGFKPNGRCEIAVLGSPINKDSPSDYSKRLFEDLTLENSTIERAVTSIEIKIENSLLLKDTLANHLKELSDLFSGKDLRIFIEPDLSGDSYLEITEKTLHFIKETNRDLFGFKVRGTGPIAIGNEKIGEIIELVAHEELHFKATAGLHHPIIEVQRYGNNLGFLNLSLALYLKRHYRDKFSGKELAELLESESPEEFSIDDNSIGWREYSLSRDELTSLKKEFPFSIGSCSLYEPDEDLNRLFSSSR